MKYTLFFIAGVLLSCSAPTTQVNQLYLGGDLSYVNELEDCGAVYRKDGQVVDPYELFAEEGANIVRLRLWHNPDWTDYSTYPDIEKSIRRAKKAGMKVLLDFHYSDNWADPGDQVIPQAWANISDLEVLGDSMYQYTYQTLKKLIEKDLTPDFVQVGNETNSEILLSDHVNENTTEINWERNVFLFNQGIKAVNDIAEKTGQPIETMLHIAQPENAFPWFKAAFANGIADFDWIGLSYYAKWSEYPIEQVSEAIDSLTSLYQKPVMIVETAYPYGFVSVDSANNILNQDAISDAYPATQEGQLKYMQDLTQEVIEGGGKGVIYWEPAWVSSTCETRWGKGSHWENATFFDAANGNEALPVFDFFDVK
jgi:arabinogalactan endo-1,4-beta-galactosidase